MKPPDNIKEWIGEALAAACVIALPLVLLFIGAALGLS
jgi:hypothetical protein